MPPFSKCPGHECPVKDKCRRFTAPSDEHQDWLAFTPYDYARGSCDYYQPAVKVKPAKAKGA